MPDNVPAAPQPPPAPVTRAAKEDAILERIHSAVADPVDAETAPESPAQGEDLAPEAKADAPAPQPDGDDQPAAAEDDESVVRIGTLEELAEHIGVNVADLYDLPLRLSGDGEESTIGQAKDELQNAAALRKAAAKQKADQSAFETERKEAMEAWQQSVRDGAALVGVMEKQLTADMDGVDWNGLRAQSPAEWAAKRQEFQERGAAIQRAKQEVQERHRQGVERQRAESSKVIQERLQREREALLAAVPDWQDEGKQATEVSELRAFLSDSGFSAEEIDNAADHRLILLARDAMRYRSTAAKADAAKKRVIKIGKTILKPGRAPSKGDAKADRIDPLKAKLKKSGSVDDAVALMRARRGN